MNRFKTKGRVLILIVIVAFIFLEEAIFSRNDNTTFKLLRPFSQINKDQEPREFWQPIFDLYNENKIKREHKVKLKRGLKRPFPRDRESLMKRCDLSKEQLDVLQQKHTNIVENLPNGLARSTYKKGSKGIVIIGGGFFSWLAMVLVVQIRALGSVLPIEIILPKRVDYDPTFCDIELPKYNARCMVIADVLGLNETQLKFVTHQYKGVALLANSFQHLLLLDTDNFPVTNVDKYFDAPVYKKHNMVLWRDFWKRSAHPLYYDIAKLPVNVNKQVRLGALPLIDPVELTKEQSEAATFHDLEGTIPEFSTESGQILVNRETHGKMLLLAMYYNILGRDVYYQIFSLGARGKGDRDTFAAAALVTGSDYYQVKSLILRFQMELDNGEMQHIAMGQRDPELDYELYNKEYKKLLKDPKVHGKNLEEQTEILSKFFDEHFENPKVPVFAVHCNTWKFNPASYMNIKHITDKEANCLKKRIYSHFTYPDRGKEIDFESRRFEIAHKLLCEEKIQFKHFKNQNMDRACEYTRNSIAWLKEN